jgi:hypothetical protein
MQVTINESPVKVPQQVQTWGDLLDWLETDYLNVGHCITRVAVDGQEEVDYRNPNACEQNLEKLGPIQVQSSAFDLVLQESLVDLERELDVAIESATRVISLLEERDEAQAYHALAQLLDAVRIFFTITCEDLGWVDPKDIEIPRPAIPSMLERALSQVIAAQESRSWLLLCDIIQYEIVPILESWKTIVISTRAARN